MQSPKLSVELRHGGWSYRADLHDNRTGLGTKYYRYDGGWKQVAWDSMPRAAYSALRQALKEQYQRAGYAHVGGGLADIDDDDDDDWAAEQGRKYRAKKQAIESFIAANDDMPFSAHASPRKWGEGVDILAHKDTHAGRVGMWRITRFENLEPFGHTTFDSYADTVKYAVDEYGVDLSQVNVMRPGKRHVGYARHTGGGTAGKYTVLRSDGQTIGAFDTLKAAKEFATKAGKDGIFCWVVRPNGSVARHVGGGKKFMKYRLMAYDGDYKSRDMLPNYSPHSIMKSFARRPEVDAAAEEFMRNDPPTYSYADKREPFVTIEEQSARFGPTRLARWTGKDGKWIKS